MRYVTHKKPSDQDHKKKRKIPLAQQDGACDSSIITPNRARLQENRGWRTTTRLCVCSCERRIAV